MVIELAVDPAAFREPASIIVEPWTVGPAYEPWFDRLHHLVWANAYDARAGPPIWWWARKAARLGATEAVAGPADILLPDGSPAWVDGGPRRPFAPEEVGGAAIVHADAVADGILASVPVPCTPTADLAADQLAAVAHGSVPAPRDCARGLRQDPSPDRAAATPPTRPRLLPGRRPGRGATTSRRSSSCRSAPGT